MLLKIQRFENGVTKAVLLTSAAAGLGVTAAIARGDVTHTAYATEHCRRYAPTNSPVDSDCVAGESPFTGFQTYQTSGVAFRDVNYIGVLHGTRLGLGYSGISNFYSGNSASLPGGGISAHADCVQDWNSSGGSLQSGFCGTSYH
jgi:hypothetical protein